MRKRASTRKKRSPRVKEKYERARTEILEVARAILSEGGVEAVTLAAVATELRMTKQALYHYFPSKEALVREMVTSLLDEEISRLIAAVENTDSASEALGTMIRTFYDHYIGNLDALRLIYCQSQLFRTTEQVLDGDTVRSEINPRTRHLFDVLEERIAGKNATDAERKEMRRLAFTAWLAALGLMTMLGIADAAVDPLIHNDEELLDTLSGVFNAAVESPANGKAS